MQYAPDRRTPILTKDRQETAARLKARNLVGVMVEKLWMELPIKNFAVFSPVTPIGSKLVIHGRDLFSNEQTATDYFSLTSEQRKKFPVTRFGDAARNKIHAVLSPAGLRERLYDYDKPASEVAMVRQEYQRLKTEYPRAGLHKSENLSPYNAYAVLQRLQAFEEAQGVDITQRDHDRRHPSDAALVELRKKRETSVTRQVERFFARQTAPADQERLQAPLLAYLKAQDFDPETFYNFSAGYSNGDSESVEAVITRGLERRVEIYLRALAEQVDNPYNPRLQEAEERFAVMIAKAAQPRILERIFRTGTPILGTDSSRARNIMTLFGSESHAGSAGFYHEREIHPNRNPPLTHDPIVITMNDFDLHSIRCTGRHEMGHRHDFGAPEIFAQRRKTQISAAITEDKTHLEWLIREAKKYTEGSNPTLESLRAMRARRDGCAGMLDVMRTLESIQKYGACFLSPNDDTQNHYGTTYTQHSEIPAILDDFSYEYGTAFMKIALPELYKLYREHRHYALKETNPRGR